MRRLEATGIGCGADCCRCCSPRKGKQIPVPEIHAFIGFHITELIKNKGFKGYFLEEMYVWPGGPIGPYYGAYSPPRLVE